MKSDKQQMSFVPQTSEHVKVTDLTATAKPYDIKLPLGAIVEDVVVVVKTQFGDTTADINIGTVANASYYRSSAIDAGTGNASAVGVYGIDANKMMESVAADQIVRVTFDGSANASNVGEAFFWVNYRFDQNVYPTKLV